MRRFRQEREQFILNEVFFTPDEIGEMLLNACAEGLGEFDEDLVPSEELPLPNMGAVLAYMPNYDEEETITHDEPVEISFRWLRLKPIDKTP